MRPLSRGYLKLKDTNPRSHPTLQPNYLAHPQDMLDYIQAVKLTFEIMEQAALAPYRDGRLSPSPDIQSDAEIADWIRRNTESAYHPCSTCRMGVDDASVVDPMTCKVHGLEHLRVVDASIMPDEASGNLNAPTIMMAERAADLIQGRPGLPASTADVWVPPEWETRQR